MNSQIESRAIQRYIALDIHKEYIMVGAMNTAQEWVIRPRRVEMIHFRNWAANNLRAGDAVVIETTTNVLGLLDRATGKRPVQTQPGNCLAKEPTWSLFALRTALHVR